MVVLSPSFVVLALLTVSNAAAVPRQPPVDHDVVDLSVERPAMYQRPFRDHRTRTLERRSPSSRNAHASSSSASKDSSAPQVLPLPAPMARKAGKVAAASDASNHVTDARPSGSTPERAEDVNLQVNDHRSSKGSGKHHGHHKNHKRYKNRMPTESPSMDFEENSNETSAHVSSHKAEPQSRRLDSRLFRNVAYDDDGNAIGTVPTSLVSADVDLNLGTSRFEDPDNEDLLRRHLLQYATYDQDGNVVDTAPTPLISAGLDLDILPAANEDTDGIVLRPRRLNSRLFNYVDYDEDGNAVNTMPASLLAAEVNLDLFPATSEDPEDAIIRPRRLDSRLFRNVAYDDDGDAVDTVPISLVSADVDLGSYRSSGEEMTPSAGSLVSRFFKNMAYDQDSDREDAEPAPLISAEVDVNVAPSRLEDRNRHRHGHHHHHRRAKVGLSVNHLAIPVTSSASVASTVLATQVTTAITSAAPTVTNASTTPSPVPTTVLSAQSVDASAQNYVVYVPSASNLLDVEVALKRDDADELVQRSHAHQHHHHHAEKRENEARSHDEVVMVPAFYLDHHGHFHFRHGWPHVHKRDDIPDVDTGDVPAAGAVLDPCSLDGAAKGVLQLMAPTTESEAGVKLSELALVVPPTPGAPFVLDASNNSKTEMYLVSSSDLDPSGKPLVHLIAQMFDPLDASLMCLCTTFSPESSSESSPLTLEQCTGQAAAVNSSQSFAFDPATSIITPLWNTPDQAPSKRSTPPAGMYVAQDGPSENVATGVNMASSQTQQNVTAEDAASTVGTQNVALKFSPLTDNVLPFTAAEAFGALDNDGSDSTVLPTSAETTEDGDVSSTTADHSPTTSDAEATPTPSCDPADEEDEPATTSTDDSPKETAAPSSDPSDVPTTEMDPPMTPTTTDTATDSTATSSPTDSMAAADSTPLTSMPPSPYQYFFQQ